MQLHEVNPRSRYPRDLSMRKQKQSQQPPAGKDNNLHKHIAGYNAEEKVLDGATVCPENNPDNTTNG